jgi:hypothetical protein
MCGTADNILCLERGRKSLASASRSASTSMIRLWRPPVGNQLLDRYGRTGHPWLIAQRAGALATLRRPLPGTVAGDSLYVGLPRNG